MNYIKSKIITCTALTLFSTNAISEEYLCYFNKNGSKKGDQNYAENYSGSHLFSTDAEDIVTLPCGEVNQRWEKLTGYQLVSNGHMNMNWGQSGTLTTNGGYFQVKIFKESKDDGQSCTTTMDISLSGTNLYYGPLLTTFGASSVGMNTSSGMIEFVWRETNYSLVSNHVTLSSFDGSSYFNCVQQP
jgi:hypothetical protein